MQSDSEIRKILILRFSSIGDIVLTTPVVRALKKRFPNASLHYLTKHQFRGLIEPNPNVSKVWSWEEFKSTPLVFKEQGFDLLVDLHKNLRSKKVARALGMKAITFNKLNIKKWQYVNLKRPVMPNIHLVDRYIKGLQELGAISSDEEGLEYFYSKPTSLPDGINPKTYIAVVLGAAHFTKQIPNGILKAIMEQLPNTRFVLLGGKADKEKGKVLADNLPHAKNWAGRLSLDESAKVVEMAKSILTPDTGLMHIAAAFRVKSAVVWGNTTPELGMYPYKNPNFKNFEVKGLPCRPCSKIGKKKCPKTHFNCMMGQDIKGIADYLDA